jgi:hypothetical protein
MDGNMYMRFERPLPQTFTDTVGNLEMVFNYSELADKEIPDPNDPSQTIIVKVAKYRLTTNIYPCEIHDGGVPDVDIDIDLSTQEVAQINGNKIDINILKQLVNGILGDLEQLQDLTKYGLKIYHIDPTPDAPTNAPDLMDGDKTAQGYVWLSTIDATAKIYNMYLWAFDVDTASFRWYDMGLFPSVRPNHQWSGTELSIENPDGSYTDWVDLKGDKGDDGVSVDMQQGVYAVDTLPAFEDTAEGQAYLVLDADSKYDLYIHGIGGTDWTIIDDWGGVPGPQGAKGDKGDKGDPGKDGDGASTQYTIYPREIYAGRDVDNCFFALQGPVPTGGTLTVEVLDIFTFAVSKFYIANIYEDATGEWSISIDASAPNGKWSTFALLQVYDGTIVVASYPIQSSVLIGPQKFYQWRLNIDNFVCGELHFESFRLPFPQPAKPLNMLNFCDTVDVKAVFNVTQGDSAQRQDVTCTFDGYPFIASVYRLYDMPNNDWMDWQALSIPVIPFEDVRDYQFNNTGAGDIYLSLSVNSDTKTLNVSVVVDISYGNADLGTYTMPLSEFTQNQQFWIKSNPVQIADIVANGFTIGTFTIDPAVGVTVVYSALVLNQQHDTAECTVPWILDFV